MSIEEQGQTCPYAREFANAAAAAAAAIVQNLGWIGGGGGWAVVVMPGVFE